MTSHRHPSIPRFSRLSREEKRFLACTCLVPFRQAQRDIYDADLLLFRKHGAISVAGRGIHSHAAKAAWWNNDLFCLEVREFHGGRAVTLESQTRRYPGRIDVFRANADNRWPEYNRARAAAVMRRFAGCDYGYWNVFKTALTHVPGIRFFCRPAFRNDGDDRWKAYLFPSDKYRRDAENESPYEDTRWIERDWAWNDFCSESDAALCGELSIKDEGDESEPVKISPPYCSEACSLADRLGGGVNPVELLSDRFTEPADLARSPFYRYLFTLG